MVPGKHHKNLNFLSLNLNEIARVLAHILINDKNQLVV